MQFLLLKGFGYLFVNGLYDIAESQLCPYQMLTPWHCLVIYSHLLIHIKSYCKMLNI